MLLYHARQEKEQTAFNLNHVKIRRETNGGKNGKNNFMGGLLCERTPVPNCVAGEQYVKGRTSDQVIRKKLYEKDWHPLDVSDIARREQLTGEQNLNHPLLKDAVEFAGADQILFTAPYWDLSFPAVLKLYLENIAVAGITFTYQDNRPVGLCNAQEAVYITTAGGYTGENLGFCYIQAMMKLFGIEKTRCIAAEGLDIEGANVKQILRDTAASPEFLKA
ncbi:MAG: NAD(P)H-dependent oxidoreductase [Eubacteriaceae bacterium]|nr:NAD(P)H-dependent oxidoreductase [Eubacteriaceae bacterium]